VNLQIHVNLLFIKKKNNIMGQKVHPIGLRLGVSQNWSSSWNSTINYSNLLYEDLLIRKYLEQQCKPFYFLIGKLIIKRSLNKVHIILCVYNEYFNTKLYTHIKEKSIWYLNLRKFLFKLNKSSCTLSIIQTKNIHSTAELLGYYISKELKKKRSVGIILQNIIKQVKKNKKIKGIKIVCSGRFNGVQMAKKEFIKYGKIPLNSLNLKIDYSKQITKSIYGVYGIKIWIYK